MLRKEIEGPKLRERLRQMLGRVGSVFTTLTESRGGPNKLPSKIECISICGDNDLMPRKNNMGRLYEWLFNKL